MNRLAKVSSVRSARMRGFSDGLASLFRVTGRNRPAPPRVRRNQGSLRGDMNELKRDSDRLINTGEH